MDKYRGEYIQIVKLTKKETKYGTKEERQNSVTSKPASVVALTIALFSLFFM